MLAGTDASTLAKASARQAPSATVQVGYFEIMPPVRVN